MNSARIGSCNSLVLPSDGIVEEFQRLEEGPDSGAAVLAVANLYDKISLKISERLVWLFKADVNGLWSVWRVTMPRNV